MNKETNLINKSFFYYIIKIDKKNIGEIKLVSYLKDATPHIEYEIYKKEYMNRGIMSRMLPRYLIECKENNYNQLVALVQKNNIASIKLLEKNNFARFCEIEDKISYLIDFRFSKQKVEKIINHAFYKSETNL